MLIIYDLKTLRAAANTDLYTGGLTFPWPGRAAFEGVLTEPSFATVAVVIRWGGGLLPCH